MTNNDELAIRERFEAWAEEVGALPWGILSKHRNQDGSYPGPHCTCMWHAWKACHEGLLAERDADKKRIAELEDKQRETLRQARSFREAHESASEIIRRYESKTIKLIPPTTRLWAGSVDCYEAKEILIAVRAACAAAGIKLEVGE